MQAAERSYPTFEVRGSGLACQAVMVQEWPRGATMHPRSGVAAERSYPESEVSGGWEETPGVRGQGSGWEEQPEERWLHSAGGPRGAIPH